MAEHGDSGAGEQPPVLGKRLFGYRRSAVDQLLTDRDVMLRQAEGRIRAAEAKAARLEAELVDLQQSNALLEERLHDVDADVQDPGDVGAEVTSRFLNEELAAVLTAAEESASRMVERARASTQEQVEEAERTWREAQSQLARFEAWREHVEPALHGAQARIDEVRTRIEEVPDQIRQALAALAEAVASLDGDLAELSGASTPPSLLPPEGLTTPSDQPVEVEELTAAVPEADEDPVEPAAYGEGSGAEIEAEPPPEV